MNNHTPAPKGIRYHLSTTRDGLPALFCIASDLTDYLGLGRNSSAYVRRHVSAANWMKDSIRLPSGTACRMLLLTDAGVDELLDGIGTAGAQKMKAALRKRRDPYFRMAMLWEMMVTEAMEC